MTTTRLTHASPAASYASTVMRNYEGASPPGSGCVDIAKQLVTSDRNQKIKVGFYCFVVYIILIIYVEIFNSIKGVAWRGKYNVGSRYRKCSQRSYQRVQERRRKPYQCMSTNLLNVTITSNY